MTRVLVAMSGGVDSSVAAALVRAAGDEAIGVWMRLHDVADAYSDFKKSCCSLDAADDARRVAVAAETGRAATAVAICCSFVCICCGVNFAGKTCTLMVADML